MLCSRNVVFPAALMCALVSCGGPPGAGLGDETFPGCPKGGLVFVYARLYNDTMNEPLWNVPFMAKGVMSGLEIEGRTDGDGLLFLKCLPDDYFEITACGQTEQTQVYYMSQLEAERGKPWYLRMRGCRILPDDYVDPDSPAATLLER